MPKASPPPEETVSEPNRRSRRGLRGFRLWEKKRGSRQTGSSWWGGTGETIFYAALFLVGVVVLTELISLRVIWNTNNFLTSNWGLALSVLVLGALIVTGAIGAISTVVTTGTSAERRAAIARSALDNELLSETVKKPSRELPGIPDDANWKNSPGVRLAYRLPHATSPGWRLGVVASFCLLWNGTVAVLAVLAFNQGDGVAVSIASLFTPGWWTLFRIVVLVYATIGILIIRYLVEMLMNAAAIGPTTVEISSLPLFPGEEYRVAMSQSGQLEIARMELQLVCDEEVSFSDGTDSRTESRRVYEASVFDHEDFEIVPSRPFECDCPLNVPADAMHSFVVANNAVTWKLIVRLQPKVDESRRKLRWFKWLRPISTRFKAMMWRRTSKSGKTQTSGCRTCLSTCDSSRW